MKLLVFVVWNGAMYWLNPMAAVISVATIIIWSIVK